MKKKIAITLFLIMIMMATNVFAVAKATDVTMSIVEDNVCTIKLNEKSEFEKKMIEYDLSKHQVTLQLKVSNNAKANIPSGEMMLVIDSSSSMNQNIDKENVSRKETVLNSANKLVENLLESNPTSLKIGVVTFSSGTEKDENGYLITGTEADAQKVCDFTNDVKVLKSKISEIKGTGAYTDLDSGLKLAQKQFSNDKSNKYMIVLTDGLPNLAIGHNELGTYKGQTEVINATKATIQSLDNVELITMLTGIDNEEAYVIQGEQSYTYGQIIKEVFGTEEQPTKGKFYKISDNEIEETITNKIYKDLMPSENALENIIVVDYFPQYMVDNFEMTYVDGIDVSNVSSKIDLETNSITWNLSKLPAGQTAIIQYNLKLKDEFDEKIIDQVLDTNQKVDVNYKDFDGKTNTETSDVTPKIKLTKVPVTPVVPADNTIAPEPIPKAGTHMTVIGMFIAMIGISVFLGLKSRKIK